MRNIITSLFFLLAIDIPVYADPTVAQAVSKPATTLSEWQAAANQGDLAAQAKLGFMYYVGQGIAQDHKEALKWYRLAADQAHSPAQYNLGVMFEHGQGAPRDYKEAIKWYRLAADQGNIKAQYNLGVIFCRGEGVPQDYVEGTKWYLLAAEQGNAAAQASLGVIYDQGQGVPKDYKEAVKWYRLAADQGNAKAQGYLGTMYADGHGVSKSRFLAYALHTVSSANDSSDTTKPASRTALVTGMPPREAQAAQELAKKMLVPGKFLTELDQFVESAGAKDVKVSSR